MKYLFTAVYADGETLYQNPQDVSSKDPKRSAFFDVDQERLVRFFLEGAGHRYSVDLRDGGFTIDDVPFRMHGDEIAIRRYRLIFWREHEVKSRMEVRIDAKGNPVPMKELKTEEAITYYKLGWQGNTPDGKNHQRILYIR